MRSGATATQSETSLALNENTGTLCSGYNDAYSGVVLGQGYTGFSSSTDGGATFVDRGALDANSFGDPSLVWRRSDGKFYFAALHSNGLGIWRTDDDCETFVFHAMIHTGWRRRQRADGGGQQPRQPVLRPDLQRLDRL